MNLHEKIIEATDEWRAQGYPCESYPAIKYILEHNYNADMDYRFLRAPQFQALEIYWYLRLKLDTPQFLLYTSIFTLKTANYVKH